MQKNNSTVFIAKNISDVFYHLKSVSNLQILGGCTYLQKIGEKTLSVRSIPELKSIEKKEHYITFGSAVTLSQILNLGRNKLPAFFYEAIESVANPAVRNMATLGGNICCSEHRLTLFALLLAMDARLEFENDDDSITMPFSKFTEVPKGFILTKIKVPFEDWEISIFKRVGPEHLITPLSASFVFLADTQQNFLTNLKIAFAGQRIFRSIDLENSVIGSRLPLSKKTIDMLVEKAEVIYLNKCECFGENENPPEILRIQFLNLLRSSFQQLT